MSRKPIAILCSDLHLQHKPPGIRANEPDWYAAMQRGLMQMKRAAEAFGVPVICAGDVFDRYNSPPELINFALDALPDGMWCIPGQHDLPYHGDGQLHRSAYHTLAAAGKINHMAPGVHDTNTGLTIGAAPWGHPIPPLPAITNGVALAVVHRFVWVGKHGYTGAPKEEHLRTLQKELAGYDVALFGDNHKGFTKRMPDGGCTVFNHGTFFRRTTHDVHYNPGHGVLYSDGTVLRAVHDVSADILLDVATPTTTNNATQLAVALGDLTVNPLDFADVVKEQARAAKVAKPVIHLLKDALDEE